MPFFPLRYLALVGTTALAACAGTSPPPAGTPPRGEVVVEVPMGPGSTPGGPAGSSDPGSRGLPQGPMGALAVETEPRPPTATPPHPPFSRPAAPLRQAAQFDGTPPRAEDRASPPAPPLPPPPEPPSWEPPTGPPAPGSQAPPDDGTPTGGEEADWPPTRAQAPPPAR